MSNDDTPPCPFMNAPPVKAPLFPIVRLNGFLFLALAFCLTSVKAQDDLGNFRLPPIAYQSMWAELYPATLVSRDDGGSQSPVFQDFYAAAKSQRLRSAKRRWEQFDKKYGPVEGGFEDATQERLWKWAEMELKRCTFLLDKDQAKVAAIEKSIRKYAAEQDGN